jgi:hypothetical protein
MNPKWWLVFGVLIILAGFLQFSYDSRVDYFSEKETFVSVPSGQTLKVLSFGNNHFVADMLFIWSIQFYSTLNLTNRFDYIEDIFDVITDLNPHYRSAYYYGAIIMALEAREFRMAIRLLQKGSRNMKNEWIFDYESGYYAYKFLKDHELAESYYLKASQNPKAPSMVKRRRAHMTYIRNDLSIAYKLWNDIYKSARTQLEKDASIFHLYQIKFEMDKKRLEKKIQSYKIRYGRNPPDLNKLKYHGFIKEVPRDFHGNDYIYNMKNGTIHAKRIYRWKKFH